MRATEPLKRIRVHFFTGFHPLYGDGQITAGSPRIRKRPSRSGAARRTSSDCKPQRLRLQRLRGFAVFCHDLRSLFRLWTSPGFLRPRLRRSPSREPSSASSESHRSVHGRSYPRILPAATIDTHVITGRGSPRHERAESRPRRLSDRPRRRRAGKGEPSRRRASRHKQSALFFSMVHPSPSLASPGGRSPIRLIREDPRPVGPTLVFRTAESEYDVFFARRLRQRTNHAYLSDYHLRG